PWHRMPSSQTPMSGVPQRSLAIIIPAYNESHNILATLENIATALESLSLCHEILVIDDGSADATAALVESHLSRFPTVQLLRNPRNMGFGWSYRRGVEASSLACRSEEYTSDIQLRVMLVCTV